MEQLKALEILKELEQDLIRNEGVIKWDCSISYLHKVTNAIAELEALQSTKKCTACNCTLFEDTLLTEGTWMGTKPLPSEFFRKSEFDFGWDYYPRKDTLQSKCKNCGRISYSVPKDTL